MAVYARSSIVFMGMGPVRKVRKETEGGDRYGRDRQIRARSFNQPAVQQASNHPTSPQRSRHLILLNSSYPENRKEQRKAEEKILDERKRTMSRWKKRKRERKSGCPTPLPPCTLRSTNGRLFPPCVSIRAVWTERAQKSNRIQREIGVRDGKRDARALLKGSSPYQCDDVSRFITI